MAQSGESPNGEFTYEYISPHKVETRFDVINVGMKEVSINDEGHLYYLFNGSPYFLSAPFNMDDTHEVYGFIEFDPRGIATKLLTITPQTMSYSDLTTNTLPTNLFRPSTITWNDEIIKL